MSPEEKKKKDLGIYYTDERIVSFIFDILLLWKKKEDKERYRWHFPSGKKKYPSVIDPACGEGTFLKIALDKGFTGKHPQWNTPYIFGIDIDERAFQNWSKITLSSYFPDERVMRKHFKKQNGLIPLPKDILPYKTGGLHEFDCVVGNPPYGGVGLQKIDEELEDALIKYKIWRKFFSKEKQLSLLPETLGRKNREQLKKFPIEILFVDRFIQLTKLGGYIAIILPDGIFANSNLYYVRQFITDNTRVEAIISLPRGAFKNVGTSAKTSILFLRKLKKDKLNPHLSSPPLRGRIEERGERNNLDYNVFLGAVEDIDNLKELFKFYKEVFGMNNIKEKVKVIKDTQGNEAVMARVDKTMKELMEEKPHSRWDVHYWHPCVEDIFRNTQIELKTLRDFLPSRHLIFPDHVRQSLGEKVDRQQSIPYFRVTEFLNTGYNCANQYYCSKNAYERLKHTQLKDRDIIIAYSGATLGSTLIIEKAPKFSCTGDLYVAKVQNINPYFVTVFMKTAFAKGQIKQFMHGVASPKLSTDFLKKIKIPILHEKVQSHIEAEYKKMSVYHDKAMEAKAKNDEANYKKNIETAEKMLKDLISKTEAVIRGERKDVL